MVVTRSQAQSHLPSHPQSHAIDRKPLHPLTKPNRCDPCPGPSIGSGKKPGATQSKPAVCWPNRCSSVTPAGPGRSRLMRPFREGLPRRRTGDSGRNDGRAGQRRPVGAGLVHETDACVRRQPAPVRDGGRRVTGTAGAKRRNATAFDSPDAVVAPASAAPDDDNRPVASLAEPADITRRADPATGRIDGRPNRRGRRAVRPSGGRGGGAPRQPQCSTLSMLAHHYQRCDEPVFGFLGSSCAGLSLSARIALVALRDRIAFCVPARCRFAARSPERSMSVGGALIRVPA